MATQFLNLRNKNDGSIQFLRSLTRISKITHHGRRYLEPTKQNILKAYSIKNAFYVTVSRDKNLEIKEYKD